MTSSHSSPSVCSNLARRARGLGASRRCPMRTWPNALVWPFRTMSSISTSLNHLTMLRAPALPPPFPTPVMGLQLQTARHPPWRQRLTKRCHRFIPSGHLSLRLWVAAAKSCRTAPHRLFADCCSSAPTCLISRGPRFVRGLGATPRPGILYARRH